VDERRDPILSTVAAAKLLKLNFKALQSWPLAITAYNHGTQGMKNAKKRYGVNIVDVINGYRSRSFGFASKNFYAEFLAALHVVKNKKKYFPYANFDKPLNLSSVVFKDFVHINRVMSSLNMTRDEIEKYITTHKDYKTSLGYAVRVDKFSDSSIDMYIRCFTVTDNWDEWLQVKERLALEIKQIVEKNNASFAFPSQSIYVEKK